jgi:hypothetical protein
MTYLPKFSRQLRKQSLNVFRKFPLHLTVCLSSYFYSNLIWSVDCQPLYLEYLTHKDNPSTHINRPIKAAFRPRGVPVGLEPCCLSLVSFNPTLSMACEVGGGV